MSTTGTILELGSGWYSTPILHEIAAAQGRRLITVDNDPAWLNQFAELQDRNHTLIRVDDWDQFEPHGEYGLVFVDHAPGERRSIEMMRLKAIVGLFVVHDTDTTLIPWTSLYRGGINISRKA